MSRPAPEVSPQAWQEFIAAHSDGGVLHGQVVSVVPFGAFVECAEGIHGLLHKSEWATRAAAGDDDRGAHRQCRSGQPRVQPDAGLTARPGTQPRAPARGLSSPAAGRGLVTARACRSGHMSAVYPRAGPAPASPGKVPSSARL